MSRTIILGGCRACTRSIHCPDKTGKGGEVFVGGKELRLEAPHLTGRCGSLGYGAAADDPAHRRITTQAIGVVHVLVAAKAAEDGLPEQAFHRVLAVLARARIDEFIADHQGQAEGIIEFAIAAR